MNFVKLPILEDLLTIGMTSYTRHDDEGRKQYLRKHYPDTCSVMTGFLTSILKIFLIISGGILIFTLTVAPWILFLTGFIIDGIVPFSGFTNDMVALTAPEAAVIVQGIFVLWIVIISVCENYRNRYSSGQIKESILKSAVAGWIGNYCKKVEW